MKIHLGCGYRRLDGFVHVDPDPGRNPDYVGSANNLPFDDDSVELIYFSHGLEHVKKQDVEAVVLEFKRVLCPGGTLRLSVPDFEALADLYQFGDVSLTRLGCINGGQDSEYDVHYAVYDYEHLACALHQNFYDIRRWRPEKVHPAGFDDFSFAKINGRLISLNVEATAK